MRHRCCVSANSDCLLTACSAVRLRVSFVLHLAGRPAVPVRVLRAPRRRPERAGADRRRRRLPRGRLRQLRGQHQRPRSCAGKLTSAVAHVSCHCTSYGAKRGGVVASPRPASHNAGEGTCVTQKLESLPQQTFCPVVQHRNVMQGGLALICSMRIDLVSTCAGPEWDPGRRREDTPCQPATPTRADAATRRAAMISVHLAAAPAATRCPQRQQSAVTSRPRQYRPCLPHH